MRVRVRVQKAAQALDVARELEQEMIAREEEIEHLIHETIRGDKLQQSDKMAELEAATLGVTTAQTALSEKVEQVVIQAVAEREKASAQLASEVQTTLVAKEEQLESLGQSVQGEPHAVHRIASHHVCVAYGASSSDAYCHWANLHIWCAVMCDVHFCVSQRPWWDSGP